MPVLSDLKRERFASAVAQGETQVNAYKSSGYSTKFPDSAASRLAKNPEVAARIEELKRRVTNRAIDAASTRVAITKEWVLRELLDNAELAKATNSASAVRNRALELIGKELGMFRDLEPIKPPRLEDLPSEDLERMLAQSIADNPPTEPAKDPDPPTITTQ